MKAEEECLFKQLINMQNIPIVHRCCQSIQILSYKSLLFLHICAWLPEMYYSLSNHCIVGSYKQTFEL